QGSSYFTGPPAAAGGFPWQGPTPGAIQMSRSSIEPGAGSVWAGMSESGSAGLEQANKIDLVQVDMMYRLLYRLGILAVEPDTEAVLPSFDHFVAHHDANLASYRIHRASTVSAGSIQLYNASTAAAAAKSQRHAQVSEGELAEADEANPLPTAAAAAAAPILPSLASASPDLRPRSVSPSLVQSTLAAARSLNRQAQSVSPSIQTPPLAATVDDECPPPLPYLANMPDKDALDMQLSLALNEPPVPLYLTEDMSQQHLVAILAMLVRQLECAVEVLDNRTHGEEARAKRASSVGGGGGTARNDSKMDSEINAANSSALQCALEQ
ncbi:hypothetical protein IWW38_006434, partial [Coemansia aciculifera]